MWRAVSTNTLSSYITPSSSYLSSLTYHTTNGFQYDEEILKALDGFSFEELVALLTAGGTAYNALFFGPVPVKPGMTVLTQGTDGVSCFAIQLAVAAVCTLIATSSSDSKLQIAHELGATHTINYVKLLTGKTEYLS